MSANKHQLTHDDLSSGLKEAIAVFVNRSPLAVSLSLCLEHPDLFMALSDKQQKSLIQQCYAASLPEEAEELCLLRYSSTRKPKKQFEPANPPISPSIAEYNARFHPMNNVLSSLKTAANLLGLADEQLFIADEQLIDISAGPDDPGLTYSDNERINDLSIKLQKLFSELTELSEYCRKKAGMA